MTATGRQILDDWLSVPNDETPQQKDLFSIKMFLSVIKMIRGYQVYWRIKLN